MLRLKYFLGAIISLPLLPIMFVQALLIRRKVPQLPEAKGSNGNCIIDKKDKSKLQIIFLGESTIAGIGVSTHEEGFSGTFAKEFSSLIRRNIDWKVYAKSGYTAKDVLQKLVTKIKERNPDIIVIGLGGNDSFTLNSPWNWRKHLKALVAVLNQRFPNCQLVFTNMPPIKEFPAFSALIKLFVGNLVELLGAELKSLSQEYDNVVYFDEIVSLKVWAERYSLENNPSLYFSDGVHPSKITYQTWAIDLARKYVQLISETKSS